MKVMCAKERSLFSKFWIVSSTDEIISKIETMNARNATTDLSSFDFATLYTNLEHESLKKELRWVVEEAFRSSGKNKLAVYEETANWVDNPKEDTKTVDKDELIEWINFLIDNIVIDYGGAAYKQCIGIPMGTDCAPFLANLYLFALEYRWVTKKEKEEGGIAFMKGLGINSRYIDDLLSINGTKTIERYKEEIYPGLVLKKENNNNHKTHILDLDLQLNKRQILLASYDKRDAFSFVVRSFPDLTGNIHITKTHSVIVGQLGRFAKTCGSYSDFRVRVMTLTSKLLCQAFCRELLEERIRKFFQEKETEVMKYRQDIEQLVKNSFEEEKEEIRKKRKRGNMYKNRKERIKNNKISKIQGNSINIISNISSNCHSSSNSSNNSNSSSSSISNSSNSSNSSKSSNSSNSSNNSNSSNGSISSNSSNSNNSNNSSSSNSKRSKLRLGKGTKRLQLLEVILEESE